MNEKSERGKYWLIGVGEYIKGRDTGSGTLGTVGGIHNAYSWRHT